MRGRHRSLPFPGVTNRPTGVCVGVRCVRVGRVRIRVSVLSVVAYACPPAHTRTRFGTASSGGRRPASHQVVWPARPGRGLPRGPWGPSRLALGAPTRKAQKGPFRHRPPSLRHGEPVFRHVPPYPPWVRTIDHDHREWGVIGRGIRSVVEFTARWRVWGNMAETRVAWRAHGGKGPGSGS